MRLKSFSSYGFKSFAEKIELNFEDGITAIVGPNGSGKSNISDAIRWVLGEQSVKYLRGSKMEDVIFSGTNKRRALGMAEVTLVFDNADHQLNVEFDEVSLCRRVFRSGDSEYYINKKSCRLKDIVDLLADTGLGRGSMSVIGQNKIDEILNSRPEERRALFEEAAGIAKYRMRKKEATRRLEDTANNITRIYDIKAELETRIEPLRISAEKTKTYLKLNKELKACNVTQFVNKIENIEGVNDKLKNKIVELENEFNELNVNINLKENIVINIKLELDQLNEEYAQLQKDISEKENYLEKLHGKQAVLEERIAQSKRNQERIHKQKLKVLERLQEVEKDVKANTEKYDDLDREQVFTKTNVESLTQARIQLEEEIQKINEQVDNYKSNAFESMQEIVKLRNEINSLNQELETTQRKREQLKKDIAETESTYSELNERNETLESESLAVSKNIEIIKKQGRTLVEELNDEKQALATANNLRNSIAGQVSSIETRLSMLETMQKEYDGFGKGTKVILNADTLWRSGVIGVVAELLNVPDEYILAIETSLGGAVQNIVTADSTTAKKAIEYLKQRQAGRVTFLPLDTLRTNSLRGEELLAAKSEGILGVAADLVECSPEILTVVKFLLGRVLIAKNMDAALLAAKKANYRLRIVTLTGEIINAGGSITGGARQQKETGFLSRKKELQAAMDLLKELNAKLLILQENVEEKEGSVKLKQNKIDELKNSLQKNEIRRAELVAYLERLEAEKKQTLEKTSLLMQERKQYTDSYMNVRSKLQALRPTLLEKESIDQESKQFLDELQLELTRKQGKLSTVRIREQDARVVFETIREKTLLVAERIKQIDKEASRLQGEIIEIDEENEKIISFAKETSEQKVELEETQKDILSELKNVSGGQMEFANKRLAILDRQTTVETDLTDLKKRLGNCQQKMHQAEMEKVKQVAEYEAAIEQMANTYKITLEDAKNSELILDLPAEQLKKNSVKLEQAIEDLGAINMTAIEDFRAVNERHEFLEGQCKDLREAKEQLEGVISELNSNMAKRFKEAFSKINEYFAETYIKLFGGGSAKLELQDASDLLNSGIDIIVQPPGKKLQNLFLLSGGERSLTVIALLFALLSYQPAPFCILDEIDAALDEANVDRFADFLTDYAKKTQFIVITHRKGTMEAADVLHGVTMEESGISKLLSVKLEDEVQEG